MSFPKLLSALASVGIVLATNSPVQAQVPSPIAVAGQLDRAAVDGPAALLRELDMILTASPDLAANAAAAVALARAAAAPVPGFVGANMPIYRAIADRIIAAAPPSQHHAVAEAVSAALGQIAAVDPRTAPVAPTWEHGEAATTQPAPITHGQRIGDFTLYSDIKSGIFYDDNIYATNHSTRADGVATVSPRAILQSNWEKNEFVAEAQTDLTGYYEHSRENTADWHVSTEGRIDASDTTQILLGLLALQDHEDRASPDAVAGLSPTPYTQLNAYAGIAHNIGSYSIRLGGSAEQLTFGNVMGSYGEIDQTDRNRERYSFGGLVQYDLDPAFRPYIKASGVFHEYQQRIDNFGYARSSQGAEVGLGAVLRITEQLTGDAYVGGTTRDYQDTWFRDVNTSVATAYLRWEPTYETVMVLFFNRSLEETTLPGSPGYIYNIVGGRIEQALTENLTGILRAAVARAEFVDTSRNDDEGDFSVGLRYSLTEYVTLGCDYRYTVRTSVSEYADYGRNQAFFRVNVAF